MSDIPFNVQIDRVLDLLCSQIYDSPLSLLRENVQNAYDAIPVSYTHLTLPTNSLV